MWCIFYGMYSMVCIVCYDYIMVWYDYGTCICRGNSYTVRVCMCFGG